MVDGEEGSSERCLKWGGGRSLRDLPQNILKQGVGKVKAKVVRRGEGVLKVSPPLPSPPPENFNHTPCLVNTKVDNILVPFPFCRKMSVPNVELNLITCISYLMKKFSTILFFSSLGSPVNNMQHQNE